MRAINTSQIKNPRRCKRVRKFYARLVTRLEKDHALGHAAVENFYATLKDFPGDYILGAWHHGIPRKRARYRQKRWNQRAEEWRRKHPVKPWTVLP